MIGLKLMIWCVLTEGWLKTAKPTAWTRRTWLFVGGPRYFHMNSLIWFDSRWCDLILKILFRLWLISFLSFSLVKTKSLWFEGNQRTRSTFSFCLHLSHSRNSNSALLRFSFRFFVFVVLCSIIWIQISFYNPDSKVNGSIIFQFFSLNSSKLSVYVVSSWLIRNSVNSDWNGLLFNNCPYDNCKWRFKFFCFENNYL